MFFLIIGNEALKNMIIQRLFLQQKLKQSNYTKETFYSTIKIKRFKVLELILLTLEISVQSLATNTDVSHDGVFSSSQKSQSQRPQKLYLALRSRIILIIWRFIFREKVQMGTTNSKPANDNYHRWVRSSDNTCDYCTIHYQYKTDATCIIDKKDVPWNKEMYDRRAAPSKHIARIFSYEIEDNCRCSSKSIFRIETEHYQRLQSTDNHPETVYVLLSMMYGYSELFKVIKKCFLIELYMIGVTAEGEVRVWVNRNFSSNEFTFLEDHPLAEQRLVSRILQLVCFGQQRFCLTPTLTKFCHDYLKNKTFLQAIIKIKKFARVYSIRIPTCIRSLNRVQSSLIKQITPKGRCDTLYGLSLIAAEPRDREITKRKRYSQFGKISTQKQQNNSVLSLDSMIHYSGQTADSDNIVAAEMNRVSIDQSVKIYQPIQEQLEMNTFRSLFEHKSLR